MSEKIATIDITPTRAGIEHIARLFSQEIERANETIIKAEKVKDYLDSEDAINQLPGFMFDAQKVIAEGLDLLIEQEELRIQSQESGLVECRRCLVQYENLAAQAEEASVSTSESQPKAKAYIAYIVKPGDRIQVRHKLANGQSVRPRWIAGQWVTVVSLGRSTLTVQPDDGQSPVRLSNHCFDLQTLSPVAAEPTAATK